MYVFLELVMMVVKCAAADAAKPHLKAIFGCGLAVCSVINLHCPLALALTTFVVHLSSPSLLRAEKYKLPLALLQLRDFCFYIIFCFRISLFEAISCCCCCSVVICWSPLFSALFIFPGKGFLNTS